MFEINDSLFMTIPSGCGDYLYFVVIAILISKRYKNIYLYYDAIHYNSMQNILSIFINSNKINNIILLSNPVCTNDNTLYNYKKYFDVFSQNYNFMELVKIESNTYYSYVYNIYNIDTKCYFIHALNLFNIKIDDLYIIDFFLSDYDRRLSDNYYNEFISKINSDYILIFNSPKDRFQDIFSFRQYQKEFNPAYLKIIYFTDQFKYNENEYNIKDLLGGYKDLYYYNRIVENASSINLINSYPAIFFNLLMNNINYKNRFNNVSKNIYSRRLIGRNINHYNINNIDEIDDHNLILFSNFNAYYPLFFFRNRPDYEQKYYNDQGCAILHNSGERININNNIFINPRENHDKIYLQYFTKILQNNITSNKYGLSIFDDRLKNKHFIFIDLIKKTIQNNYIENLYDLNFIENQNIINPYLKENHLNIIFVKFDSIYYIWIKKREIDHKNKFTLTVNDKNEIISTDIEQPPKIYLKIIEFLISNQWVDYIFPYRNDEDKNNYINLLNS